MKQYNYGNLIWKIKEKCGTQKAFCELTNISVSTLSNYLSGKTPMPADFIEEAVEVLGLSTGEIGLYFFNPSAEKTPLSV